MDDVSQFVLVWILIVAAIVLTEGAALLVSIDRSRLKYTEYLGKFDKLWKALSNTKKGKQSRAAFKATGSRISRLPRRWQGTLPSIDLKLSTSEYSTRISNALLTIRRPMTVISRELRL